MRWAGIAFFCARQPATPRCWSQPFVGNSIFPRPRSLLVLIWDLGANIGLTMAYMAHVFPNARVIGVEPDAGNADLARRNVAPWRDRCTVVEAAAWFQDGSVGLSSLPGCEAGIRINEDLPSTTASVSLQYVAGSLWCAGLRKSRH